MGQPQGHLPSNPNASTSPLVGDSDSTSTIRARNRTKASGELFADVWEEEERSNTRLSPSPSPSAGIMPKKYQHYLVQSLSGGNKKKLSVAVANVGNPPLLAMDECTSGWSSNNVTS